MSEIKQTLTKTVIDHATNPRNAGSISDADGFAAITGPCGDTMEIWLSIINDKVGKITFWTDGCDTTIACGSIATELVKGKDVVQALGISQNVIIEALGGLPQNNAHCALLAANTIKKSIQDYLVVKKEPWKKAYRRRY